MGGGGGGASTEITPPRTMPACIAVVPRAVNQQGQDLECLTCIVDSKPAQSMMMSGPKGGRATLRAAATSWTFACGCCKRATLAPSESARARLSSFTSVTAMASAPNAFAARDIIRPAHITANMGIADIWMNKSVMSTNSQMVVRGCDMRLHCTLHANKIQCMQTRSRRARVHTLPDAFCHPLNPHVPHASCWKVCLRELQPQPCVPFLLARAATCSSLLRSSHGKCGGALRSPSTS